ncbi:unnamed protein product [Prorocentrum cordatum]|uniref:Uncharacterized protein n=1 Tax=Prorocentrum cordatum TaxID=2364126 RepID=A0ABN9Q4Q5_9DINO|nr:unnamed protein product [Polarella glacialis]
MCAHAAMVLVEGYRVIGNGQPVGTLDQWPVGPPSHHAIVLLLIPFVKHRCSLPPDSSSSSRENFPASEGAASASRRCSSDADLVRFCTTRSKRLTLLLERGGTNWTPVAEHPSEW